MAKQKSSKKKKPQAVGVDFQKVKHKVGRKLLPPSNATQIEVKSKAILLPGQSVAQEKDGFAVSSRRQTLKELLMQTSHHNDHVRKEAVLGIKDLLSRHPEELSSHAVTLVEKLCPRMIDTDKSVQNALLLLLRTSIFASLPQVVMRPLVPIFMAYIFSAMTNLSMNIRMSAFRFLDVFIQSYPSIVVAGYLGQTVQYFVEFLGKAGVLGYGESKVLEVLSSLLQLLSAIHLRLMAQNATNSGNTKMEQGPVENASQDKGRRTMALHWYKSIVPQNNLASRLEGLAGQVEFIESPGSGVFSLQLADGLVKALLNCWAEFAPVVCSGQAPDRENMECMVKTCHSLYLILLCLKPELELGFSCDVSARGVGTKLGNPMFDGNPTELQKWLQKHAIPSFTRHLMACFSVGTQLINLPKDEELLLAVKFGISEVMLESVIAGGVQIESESQDLSMLLDFVECVLDGRMLCSLSLSSSAMETYIKSMISFVPGLLHCISRESQVRLLQAFTVVFKNSYPSSKVKHVCLTCITDILKPVQVLSVRDGNKLVEGDILEFQKQWLQALPRLLWELKHNHPSSSLAVLQVLHHLGQSAPENSLLAMEYTALQPILTPFFSFLSPAKNHQARWLYGPFMKLPIECQQLAIDLLYYFGSFSSAFLKAVARCLCPELETSLVVRCVEVLQQAFCRGLIKLSDHLSFLFTLLLGRASCQESDNSQKDQAVDFQRHKVITGVVCSCLCQVGDGRVLLNLLNPPICHQLVKPLPPVASYGLIKLVAVLSGSGTAFLLPESMSEALPRYIANYIVAIIMKMGPGQKSRNEEYLMKPFIQPCFTLLSKSNKLTESVVHYLCTSFTKERAHLYATVLALLQIFQQDHVRRKLICSEDESSLLQDYKMNNVQYLEDKDLQILSEKLLTVSTSAYGWHQETTRDIRT